MLDTFVMRGEWLQHLEDLPVAKQQAIITEIVRYGVGLDPLVCDPEVQSYVRFVKGSIDNSKQTYEAKVECAKKGGRKNKVDDLQIRELAREGKSSMQIAEELGISKSSVDHSAGWKGRNSDTFEF